MTLDIPTFNPDHDLAIERLLPGTPQAIWRCWAEPELFKQWFTPPGVTVTEVENVLENGGRAFNVMVLPDGTRMENDGCFLLALPHQRLVYTDGFRAGYRPTPDPAFMCVDVTLTPESSGTRYRAHVMHGTAAQRQAHDEMGFAEGWGTTLDQLGTLIAGLT